MDNMEQKFEVREWKEGVPLPRRSDNIASVQMSFGLWAMVALVNQCKLSILSYQCAFHYALSNLVNTVIAATNQY
jgi:hypothetical protein